MDRYLFRGKRIDNGAWETGSLVIKRHRCHDESTYIADKMTGYLTPVDPNTVGQCTGMRDKEGKLIFEGDIIRFEDMGETGYEYKEGYDLINQAVVEFYNGRWSLTDYLCNDTSVIDDSMNCHDEFMLAFPASEIIGNIHDKAESEDISNGMD